MEEKSHAKSKSNDRLAFSKSDIKRLENEACKLQKAQEQLGVSDTGIEIKQGKNGVEIKPIRDDINNFDRKPYPAFITPSKVEHHEYPLDDLSSTEGLKLRDLFDSIPYVDSQQSVKVDELNGWIHIKPKLLRHGERFEHDGQTYYVTKYYDGTFGIHPTID